jgi:hypothetical protein
MKYFIICIILFFSLSLCKAQDTLTIAPTPRFEIGVLLGEPTGISAKFWHGTISATDIGAAWSFSENGLFEMYFDFMIHPLNFHAFGVNGNFPAYVGVGLAARVGDNWFFGARVPIGVEYIFNAPFTVFGEVVPQWQLVPDNQFVIGGGVGIRLKFGKA